MVGVGQSSGETSMRIRSMHESISRIEERTLQEVASLKNSTDVLTMRQEQMRKEARLTRFVVFAILSVMLALLMLFGLVKRGLFSHVA